MNKWLEERCDLIPYCVNLDKKNWLLVFPSCSWSVVKLNKCMFQRKEILLNISSRFLFSGVRVNLRNDTVWMQHVVYFWTSKDAKAMLLTQPECVMLHDGHTNHNLRCRKWLGLSSAHSRCEMYVSYTEHIRYLKKLDWFSFLLYQER